MSMCKVFACCWKRVFAMTSTFSWKNSVNLWPTSFCTPRPNLPVTPGISCLPTFAFQYPIMKRTSFGGVLESLVGLHRTIQIQLLQHYWLGHAASAAAKSLQLCLTLYNPTDGSPPGFPVPGILKARTLEWVAISFSNAWKWKVKVKLLSRVQLLATPWVGA